MFKRENGYENEITIENIERFLSVHGQRGTKTLSLMGKNQKIIDALSSNIGQQILHNVMIKMEKILPKIIQLKATDNEIIEYRILSELFNDWSNKIALFERARKEIKEA